MSKKLVLTVIAILAIGALVAGSATAFAAAKPSKVAYVINGALGDQSFFDSGYAGLQKIAKDFGVQTRVVEAKETSSLYYPSILQAAKWADVIFVISYGMEDQLKKIADMYPTKTFVNLDTVVANSKKTISSVDFREEEGSFLAGAAAALMTTYTDLKGINPEKVVGAVGGTDDPVIKNFMYGYEQGAKYIDPEMKIDVVYTGTFADPVKGKQAALQIYSRGADVVFQVAGLTGAGVLQAAKETGKYAIGVDGNQNGLEPGHVLTSDLKEVGSAMYGRYKKIRDGTYKKGVVYSYGVKEKAVGLAIDDYSKKLMPESVITKLTDIADKIVKGEIKVKEFKP